MWAGLPIMCHRLVRQRLIDVELVPLHRHRAGARLGDLCLAQTNIALHVDARHFGRFLAHESFDLQQFTGDMNVTTIRNRPGRTCWRCLCGGARSGRRDRPCRARCCDPPHRRHTNLRAARPNL